MQKMTLEQISNLKAKAQLNIFRAASDYEYWYGAVNRANHASVVLSGKPPEEQIRLVKTFQVADQSFESVKNQLFKLLETWDLLTQAEESHTKEENICQ